MNEKECDVCTRYTKAKYKHYKSWKITAIVFICLTVLLACLYFASGKLFTSTVIKYDNDVVIENNGNNNTNNDNGNVIVEKQNDSTGGVILLSVVILSGGIVGGCYIVSQKRNSNKE